MRFLAVALAVAAGIICALLAVVLSRREDPYDPYAEVQHDSYLYSYAVGD